MKMYRYDEITKEYLCTIQCQRNPLNPDVFFPIENAVPNQPLPDKEGYKSVWTGSIWTYQEDYRGKTVYCKVDQSRLEIKELGKIPDTHSLLPPNSNFDEWDEQAGKWYFNVDKEHQDKMQTEKRWVKSELALSDRCLTLDFPITESGREKVLNYRALLRNPHRGKHPSYPAKSWRPEWPEGVKRPAG